MGDNLPYIQKKEIKMCPNGQTLEEKTLVVQGESLYLCKEIFDKEWVRQ